MGVPIRIALAAVLLAAGTAAAQGPDYALPSGLVQGVEAVDADIAATIAKLHRSAAIAERAAKLEERFSRLILSKPPLAPDAASIADGLAEVRAIRAEAEAEPPLNPFFRQDLVNLETLLVAADRDRLELDWQHGADLMTTVISGGKLLPVLEENRLDAQRSLVQDQVDRLEAILDAARDAAERHAARDD